MIGETDEAVLVVAAHPDDEVLGAGATMSSLSASGRRVSVLILGEGLTARNGYTDPDAAAASLLELREKAVAANHRLGVEDVSFASLPDNRFDTVPLLEVTKIIEGHIRKIQPSILLTHSHSDLNQDHRITNHAVLIASRPLPGTPVRAVLGFEVMSATHWGPPSQFRSQWFHDVSAFLDTKLDALVHYESEMRPYPHARSYEGVRSLAHFRGAQAGVRAAESFEVLRILT